MWCRLGLKQEQFHSDFHLGAVNMSAEVLDPSEDELRWEKEHFNFLSELDNGAVSVVREILFCPKPSIPFSAFLTFPFRLLGRISPRKK